MSEERVARVRSALLRMVIGVVIIDAIAITILLLTDAANNPALRWPMLGGWLLATLAVVLPGLRDIRIARRS